jgi:hypothetical protein
MAGDFILIYAIALVGMLAALGIANFVEASSNQKKPYQNFFGLIYILFAIALILYKMQEH